MSTDSGITERICKAVASFGYMMPHVPEGSTEFGRWRDISRALYRRRHWMLAAAVHEFALGLELHETAMSGAPNSNIRIDGLAIARIRFERASVFLQAVAKRRWPPERHEYLSADERHVLALFHRGEMHVDAATADGARVESAMRSLVDRGFAVANRNDDINGVTCSVTHLGRRVYRAVVAAYT